MKYDFLDIDEVIGELIDRLQDKHVMLTGNYAPKKLIQCANLVTEMKSLKQTYQELLKAQLGIEY